MFNYLTILLVSMINNGSVLCIIDGDSFIIYHQNAFSTLQNKENLLYLSYFLSQLTILNAARKHLHTNDLGGKVGSESPDLWDTFDTFDIL